DTAPAQLLTDRPDIDVHPAVLSRPQGGNRRGVQAHDGHRFQRRSSLWCHGAPPHGRRLVTIRPTSNQYERAAARRSTSGARLPHQRVIAARLTALYGPITWHVPALWGVAYNLTNLQPTVRMFQHVIGRGLRRKLRRALEPRPALVASFHPLLNHVAVDIMPQAVPRVTVITDWIDFHQAWTDLKADCIICPSQAAYDLCRRRRVPADRLARAWLPTHPRS